MHNTTFLLLLLLGIIVSMIMWTVLLLKVFAYLLCCFNVILVFELTDAYDAFIVAVVVIGSLLVSLSLRLITLYMYI